MSCEWYDSTLLGLCKPQGDWYDRNKVCHQGLMDSFGVYKPLTPHHQVPETVRCTCTCIPDPFLFFPYFYSLSELPECQVPLAKRTDVIDQILAIACCSNNDFTVTLVSVNMMMCLAQSPGAHPYLVRIKVTEDLPRYVPQGKKSSVNSLQQKATIQGLSRLYCKYIYPTCMRRGKVIGLSVGLSVCPSVCCSALLSPRKSPDLDIKRHK